LRAFIADASHELRTPVAVIRSHAEYAQRANPELAPAIKQTLQRIRAESDRMGRLVEDLLLLARLDSGRPVADEEVDLTRLAIDAVTDAQVSGPEHHWQLDLPDEPVLLRGDDHRLHQAVANLLANAQTHTPAGTTVTVAVGSASEPNQVELTVLDDGPGIDEALLPRVFDRFAHSEGERRSDSSASTGLGLSIVSAIVRAHHGTIDVTSRPGHTEFVIQLPVGPLE
jgi:two-component system OmpR family sensor kinase